MEPFFISAASVCGDLENFEDEVFFPICSLFVFDMIRRVF